MKVLIITRGKLPLPNIKGGAVEYLIQLLIDENEKKWHDDFTVCGSYFEGIDALQRKYAYCRFINVRCESVFFKMESLIRYYINTRIKYIGNCYLSRLLKHISNTMNDYDVLIDENAPDFLPILRNKFHGRLIFHCHNDWLSNEEISVLNNCDEYWAISGFLAKKARNNGVNCKIARLYNGVDLDHYLNIDSNLVKSYQDKYGIGVGDIILLYSGRIVPEKGVLEMIQAFVNAKFDKKVKLLVVGGTFYDDTSKTAYVRRCLEAAKEYESIIFH